MSPPSGPRDALAVFPPDAPGASRTARGAQLDQVQPQLRVAHDNVERTYALNDEAAIIVCDYGKAARPAVPFPYYAEAWTGQEYLVAALMMNWGMVGEGVQCVENIRSRYDGEKRNPWDEPECGHHYARAMSSWSTVVALSGFLYDGAAAAVVAVPKMPSDNFRCFWATGTGWGTYALHQEQGHTVFTLEVLAGTLACRSCELATAGASASVVHSGKSIANHVERRQERMAVTFGETLHLAANEPLRIEVHG